MFPMSSVVQQSVLLCQLYSSKEWCKASYLSYTIAWSGVRVSISAVLKRTWCKGSYVSCTIASHGVRVPMSVLLHQGVL